MSIYSGFLDQCCAAPDKPALISDTDQVSYRQLKYQADKISAFLQHQPQSCNRVVIALDRGIDAAVALLGTLFAGACYIPLDLTNPSDRLRFIAHDTDAQYIIGKGLCPDWLENSTLWLDFDQLLDSSLPPLPVVDSGPESLAAILYTSGSTGHPKGVALSHHAMLNFSQWAGNTFEISQKDHIASLAPFHFDLSVFDLFTSLSFGANVYFLPSQFVLSPSRITTWLQDNSITCWYTVPSLLSFWSFKGALDSNSLPELNTILFAGEVFPTGKLIRLVDQLPHVSFYNLYGPTETNVCCYWPVERTRLVTDQPIPIGIPACNASLSTDQDSGELEVKCDSNFSGYWQNGQLDTTLAANSWYKTGDKVSMNGHGEICYHGRLDRMLKCSGYRVEPAEIEAVITRMDGVESCAVIGIDDPASGQRPAAVLVLHDQCKLSEVTRVVAKMLPSYMKPCKFVVTEKLPCLTSGKIDYTTLKSIIENSAPYSF